MVSSSSTTSSFSSSSTSSSASLAFPSSSAIGTVLRLVVLSVLVRRTCQDDVSTVTITSGNGPISMPTDSSRPFILAWLGTVSKATDPETSVAVGKQAPAGATSDAARYVMDDPQTNDNTSPTADTVATPASSSLSEFATGGSTTTTSSSTTSSSSFSVEVLNSSGIMDGIVEWIRFYSRGSSNGSDSTNETRTYYSSSLIDDSPGGLPGDGSQPSPDEVPKDEEGEQEREGKNRGDDLRQRGKLCREKNRRGVADREASAANEEGGGLDGDYRFMDKVDEKQSEMVEGMMTSETGSQGEEAEEEEEQEQDVEDGGSEDREEEERGLPDCVETSTVRPNGATSITGIEGVNGAASPSPPPLPLPPSPSSSLPPLPQQTTDVSDQASYLADAGEREDALFDIQQPSFVLHSGNDSEDLEWLENGENGFVRTFCYLSLATIAMFALIVSVKHRQEIFGRLKHFRLVYTTRDRRQEPMVEEANTLLSHAQV